MIKSAFWKDCSNCAEGKGSRVGSRVGQWLNMVSQEAMAAVRLNVLNLGDITFSNPDAQDSPRPVETRISWWERMVPGISNWNLPHPAPRIFHCAAKFRKQWFWQVMIAGSSRELDGFARSLVGDYFVNNRQARGWSARDPAEVINLSTERELSRRWLKHLSELRNWLLVGVFGGRASHE